MKTRLRTANASALRAYVHSMPRDVWPTVVVSAFRKVSPAFTGVFVSYLPVITAGAIFPRVLLGEIFRNN